MPPLGFEDKGFFRRKFPRRAFKRLIGVLSMGEYHMHETGEIGEGGIALISPEKYPEGQEMVVSFQIPGGDFVCQRCTVRSIANEKGRWNHGLSFENILFTHKRQIRAFVSARSEKDEIII